ncbi:MAG: RNA-protein complex protein Nop10 [Halobacteria archaeon]
MVRTKFWKCPACNLYTLREACPRCGGATRNPMPPRFSPRDPYGKYRKLTLEAAEPASLPAEREDS